MQIGRSRIAGACRGLRMPTWLYKRADLFSQAEGRGFDSRFPLQSKALIFRKAKRRRLVRAGSRRERDGLRSAVRSVGAAGVDDGRELAGDRGAERRRPRYGRERTRRRLLPFGYVRLPDRRVPREGRSHRRGAVTLAAALA